MHAKVGRLVLFGQQYLFPGAVLGVAGRGLSLWIVLYGMAAGARLLNCRFEKQIRPVQGLIILHLAIASLGWANLLCLSSQPPPREPAILGRILACLIGSSGHLFHCLFQLLNLSLGCVSSYRLSAASRKMLR